jgi:hypothetical protein
MSTDVLVFFNDTRLYSFTNISLNQNLSSFSIKSFDITFEGKTVEFDLVRDACKEKDTNILEIYTVNNVVLGQKLDKYCVAMIGNKNFGYNYSANDFNWKLTGEDIFSPLLHEYISTSAFPIGGVTIQNQIGNILNELNYATTLKYIQGNATFVNGNEYNVFIDSGETEKTSLNNPKKTKGVDFVKIDSSVNPLDLTIPSENIPRPENGASTKAFDFISSMLQFRNLILVSNGYDAITISSAKTHDTPIGDLLLNIENNGQINNIISINKGLSAMNVYPAYQTKVFYQTNNGLVIGTFIDKSANPNTQFITIIQNAPSQKAQADLSASIVANVRRAKNNEYNYHFQGSFYTNNNIRYEANQIINIIDDIGDFQGSMLISNVSLNKGTNDGVSVKITVVPINSFTYKSPEEIIKEELKIVNKNKLKKKQL